MTVEGLSDNLRMLRAKKKISQRDLADLLSTNQAAISAWENGSRSVPDYMIVKLAAYYNVSTDFLLGVDKSNSDWSSVIRVDGLSIEQVESVQSVVDNYRKLNLNNEVT